MGGGSFDSTHLDASLSLSLPLASSSSPVAHHVWVVTEGEEKESATTPYNTKLPLLFLHKTK